MYHMSNRIHLKIWKIACWVQIHNSGLGKFLLIYRPISTRLIFIQYLRNVLCLDDNFLNKMVFVWTQINKFFLITYFLKIIISLHRGHHPMCLILELHLTFDCADEETLFTKLITHSIDIFLINIWCHVWLTHVSMCLVLMFGLTIG